VAASLKQKSSSVHGAGAPAAPAHELAGGLRQWPRTWNIRLILAFVLSLSQVSSPWGAWRAMRVDERGATAVTGQFVFVAMAFACLVYAFVNDDFSVLYVAHNSNSHLPLFYRSPRSGERTRIASSVDPHLSIWSVAVAAFSRQLPLTFSSRVLA